MGNSMFVGFQDMDTIKIANKILKKFPFYGIFKNSKNQNLNVKKNGGAHA